jgi:hypothetical protein
LPTGREFHGAWSGPCGAPKKFRFVAVNRRVFRYPFIQVCNALGISTPSEAPKCAAKRAGRQLVTVGKRDFALGSDIIVFVACQRFAEN